MMVDFSVAITVGKVLAPFIKGFYQSLSAKAKVDFAIWKGLEGVDAAAAYYHKLAQVKTIWSRGDAVFIDDFYYPSRLFENKVIKTVDSFNDITPQYFVVQGIVGQGKSIFMRYLALSLFKKDKLDFLPILVELKGIAEKVSLNDLILDEVRSLGLDLSSSVFELLAKKNKIVLLLDGFDEVPALSVASVTREIIILQTAYPKLKVGVSSRPDNAIQNIPGFMILKLKELRLSDFEPFLARLGVDPVKRSSLILAIDESPEEIRSVLNTPLMLSIVVIIYESFREIPSYLSDFFDALFHVVFTQHDRKKIAFTRQHHSGLSESELQYFFEAFCFVVMNNGYSRTLKISEFNECFEKAQLYVVGVKCTVQGFKKDIVNVACLMLDDGVGLTTFLHKGILDYFSAAFVKRMDDRSVQKFYARSFNKYSQWKYVLGFLSKIDQYRHAKYYELGLVKHELEVINSLLMSKDVAALIEHVENAVPGMIFSFTPRGNLSMQNERGDSLCYELFEQLTLDVYQHNPQDYPEYLKLEGFNETVGPVDVGSAQYGFKKAVDFSGIEKLWDSLGFVAEELEGRVLAASRFVSEYDARMDLINIDFGEI